MIWFFFIDEKFFPHRFVTMSAREAFFVPFFIQRIDRGGDTFTTSSTFAAGIKGAAICAHRPAFMFENVVRQSTFASSARQTLFVEWLSLPLHARVVAGRRKKGMRETSKNRGRMLELPGLSASRTRRADRSAHGSGDVAKESH